MWRFRKQLFRFDRGSWGFFVDFDLGDWVLGVTTDYDGWVWVHPLPMLSFCWYHGEVME